MSGGPFDGVMDSKSLFLTYPNIISGYDEKDDSTKRKIVENSTFTSSSDKDDESPDKEDRFSLDVLPL